MVILDYDEEKIDLKEREIIGAVTYRIHKNTGGYIFMMAVKDQGEGLGQYMLCLIIEKI